VVVGRAAISQLRARAIAFSPSGRSVLGRYNWSARIDMAVTSMSLDSIGGRSVASGQCPAGDCRRSSHRA